MKITDLVGQYRYPLDVLQMDFNGRAKLSTICSFIILAATKHAAEHSFGYFDITSKKRAWVISRLAIEMSEYPQSTTTLVIKTWINKINRLFTERHFAIEDADGKKYGYGCSMWVSIDLETRKPEDLLEIESMKASVYSDLQAPVAPAEKIPSIGNDGVFWGSVKMRYSDVDINRHLSGIKYVEHFIDTFPVDIFGQKQIGRIDLN